MIKCIIISKLFTDEYYILAKQVKLKFRIKLIINNILLDIIEIVCFGLRFKIKAFNLTSSKYYKDKTILLKFTA